MTWEGVAKSRGKSEPPALLPCLTLPGLAGIKLGLKGDCDPYYLDDDLPPLIPLDQNPRAAVRAFPFLSSTNLDAQLNTAFGGTVSAPLEEAYQVVREQGAQIRALDALVKQLRAEKEALENQLDECHSRLATPPNIASPTRILSTSTTTPTRVVRLSQHNHTAPATLHTRPLYRPTGEAPSPPHCSASNVPSPSDHSIGEGPFSSYRSAGGVPLPSRHPAPPTQSAWPREPTQFALTQRVSPLRVLGPCTVDISRRLGIPDHHHNTLCAIVESVLPENWELSLVDSGVVDTDGVCELIRAMELDIQSTDR
jgi:hypothetical protein